ncbi:hypothetical protein ACFU8I_23310 [Streptomyces sp. NPDC057540]|uniref:hypothetical protein n=1 Tax=Streptomyces sp. NPDC057540 TaxID=3346160 RepID=UPI0036996302
MLDEPPSTGIAAPVRGDGLAAPVDTVDLDHSGFAALDSALSSGGLTDVLDTASFLPGIDDSFRSLGGLDAILSESIDLADFGLAPALTGIELPVPRLPDLGEMVGQSLLNGLGTQSAVLSNMQSQVLFLSETVNSVLPASTVDTLGLMGGISVAGTILSVVEPQINNWASVAAGLSSMANVFQPLSSQVRQLHVGLAPVLECLPTLISPLSSLEKMAGSLAPLAQMAESWAPDTFTAVQMGLSQMVQEILHFLPSMNLIGSHVTHLFAEIGAVTDWAKQLKPSALAEARYAFDAYMKGDPEPMKRFLHRCLRPRPVSEDHCQALAVAMLERAWEQEVDLTDDRSVRLILAHYARQGCDLEPDHQIRGASIGYIPERWEQPATLPGPEDLVIPRLVPWAQQFETAPVRYVASRLDDQEEAVVRAFSEHGRMTWPKASALVEQDRAQGERARRKLIRLGKKWNGLETEGREFS